MAPTSPAPLRRTMDGKIARLFGLDSEAWMRHANPVSVWSRFTVVSMLVVAVWSRTWLGWLCLLPIAAAIVWMIGNPLLFGVPTSTRNWASKAVFGERIWTERTNVDIPAEFHSRVPAIANACSLVGLALLTYGLIELDVLLTVAGVVVTHVAKLWYLDRMVLLFEHMKGLRPDYAAWEYDAHAPTTA